MKLMEDKGGLLSRLFKKKQEAPITNVAPAPQERPVQTTPPLPSSAEEREKILEKRGQKQAQSGYENRIKDAQVNLSVQNPSAASSEQIKKESEKIAMTQTLNEVARIQSKIAPKETTSERFRNLTKNPPKPDLPANPVQQVSAKEEISPTQASVQTPSQKKTEPTLSEQKTKEINPQKLKKSLRTPPSEWGQKTEPIVPQKPVNKNKSVAPFPTGTFPGVDKWQPGKGAINQKMAQEIRKEVKEMPDNSFEENAPKVKEKTAAPIQQEKIKEAA